MGWLMIVMIIVIVFGGELLFEQWRVPRVEAWALRHGFERQQTLDPLLEQNIRNSRNLIGLQHIRRFGIVLTGQLGGANACISEVLLPVSMSGKSHEKWHIVVMIELQHTFNESALRAALSSQRPDITAVAHDRQLTLQRSGLLLPRRLDDLFAQAQQILAALESA